MVSISLGVPLLEGRLFEERDRFSEDAEPNGVVLVNQTPADALWPGGTALGRELFVNWGQAGARRVVGVVGDLFEVVPALAPALSQAKG